MALATTGKWKQILRNLREDNCIPHLLPMNSSNDTILHLAASQGQTKFVRELLSLIEYEGEDEHLFNETRNTPLHVAAAVGHEETCRCIAETVPKLVKAGNVHGETPIFMAALSGCIRVFDALTSVCDYAAEIGLMRRNDGDTILHCAVSGEHFCVKVSHGSKQQKQDENHNQVGEKNFFKNSFATTIGQMLYLQGVQSPNTQRSAFTCYKLYKFLLHAMLFILAKIGFSRHINKIRRKEKKHRWAYEVMIQLLRSVDQWCEFGEINLGMDPCKHCLERIGGNNLSTMLQVDKIVFAPLLAKEITYEHNTKSTRETQQTPSGGPQPHYDPSSSRIPRTNSHMHSSTTDTSSNPQKEGTNRGLIESPFLIEGKKGVIEMVKNILIAFPTAIRDMDLEHKNLMLLAVEHRQPDIYMLMLKRKSESWFGTVDVEGNNVLHLAAKHPQEQPLLIPGAALQMQREIKWFKFVKENMPHHFSKRQNHKGQTAMEVFTETHQELAMQRAKWLGNASQSCSVVATLITTVAFATIATVPGGLLQDRGTPVLIGKLTFNIFTVSSLFALCFSAISLIMFLSILTSPYQDLDFGNDLPKKLTCGLVSLFVSISAMFLSFFSGDLFVLESKIKYVAYPIFIVTSCVALTSFPLYFEFIMQTIRRVPKRTYTHKLSF